MAEISLGEIGEFEKKLATKCCQKQHPAPAHRR